MRNFPKFSKWRLRITAIRNLTYLATIIPDYDSQVHPLVGRRVTVAPVVISGS